MALRKDRMLPLVSELGIMGKMLRVNFSREDAERIARGGHAAACFYHCKVSLCMDECGEFWLMDPKSRKAMSFTAVASWPWNEQAMRVDLPTASPVLPDHVSDAIYQYWYITDRALFGSHTRAEVEADKALARAEIEALLTDGPSPASHAVWLDSLWGDE